MGAVVGGRGGLLLSRLLLRLPGPLTRHSFGVS